MVQRNCGGYETRNKPFSLLNNNSHGKGSYDYVDKQLLNKLVTINTQTQEKTTLKHTKIHNSIYIYRYKYNLRLHEIKLYMMMIMISQH